MSTRFRWMCLGVLAFGLAVGGMQHQGVADDPKPADQKAADDKTADSKPGDPKSADSKPGSEKKSEKPAKLDQAELERKFAEKLSNCALVGRFTSDGQEGSPSEDTYQITAAKKLRDDYWMFSGIKYGKRDIQIPLVIRVVWAGDTPMMAMDKFTIPGQGTYSFRLMFHGDRYAGSWQHDEHGGHMWGRLERVKGEGDGKDAPKVEKKTEEKSGKDKKEGQAQDKPKVKVENRLRKLISVDFKDHMLFQTINEVAKQTGVTIKIEADDLKAAGYTQNMKVRLTEDDTSGLNVLNSILAKYELVVVADDARDRAIVTSAVAAKARGQTPLTAKPVSVE